MRKSPFDTIEILTRIQKVTLKTSKNNGHLTEGASTPRT